MIEEKDKSEQKAKETTNIFKEKENLFNLNFIKQLEQKKNEVQGALHENERLKEEIKTERQQNSETRDQLFEKVLKIIIISKALLYM